MRIGSHSFGMEQVQRSDIESGRNIDCATTGNEVLSELDATVAVIKTAVDVSRSDLDEAFCTNEITHTRYNAHAGGCGLA